MTSVQLPTLADAPSCESLEAVLLRLGSSRDGLSDAEAARRLQESGPNEMTQTPWRVRVLELVRGSANPLVVILLVAGGASAFLGEVADAAIIGAIVLLSAGLNVWQTFRSGRAVERLREQIAPTATVRRDGAWKESRAASS